MDDWDGVGLDLGFGVDISLPSMPRTILVEQSTQVGRNAGQDVSRDMQRETWAEVDATNRGNDAC